MEDPTRRKGLDDGLFRGAETDAEQDRRIATLERRSGGHVVTQTDDEHEREIERRAQQRVADALAGVPELMERAVERGMRRVLDDPTVQARFWERGYDELEKHAGSNAAQWLGRRLINIFVVAAFAGILTWVVMTGRLK